MPLHVHHRLGEAAVHQHVAPVVHVGELGPGGGQPSAAYSACNSRTVSGPRQEHQEAVDARARCHCASRPAGRPRSAAHVGPEHLHRAGGHRRHDLAARAAPAAPPWPGGGRCGPRPARAPSVRPQAARRADSAARRAPATSRPPRTGSQSAQACGASLIHSRRSAMRRATSSWSQGGRKGAARSQRDTATGSMVGGRSGELTGGAEYIDRCAPPGWGGWPAAPSRCAVCGAWPARAGLRRAACALRAAAPLRPCALPVPTAWRCGACLREPPPLDACYAAVSYGYPWSGLVGASSSRRRAGLGRHLRGPDAARRGRALH
jgi:hypothetical protein